MLIKYSQLCSFHPTIFEYSNLSLQAIASNSSIIETTYLYSTRNFRFY
ncbi:hypothetical protein CPARK_000098900 [cyanobacterium endosymbiont of Braarudosphaera bigelowii]|uniref:Uncharacterized protein n=1 Tax=cyanobacterium endosymbiont of Braarudosphaera bigelowii TaxID=1285375 RepID=A0ABM7U5V3_9CHRO|nr:hypothetical protein CPARK_000098900 [cyanobacterium endosymbiont of Braarudosphaera bigelowii]